MSTSHITLYFYYYITVTIKIEKKKKLFLKSSQIAKKSKYKLISSIHHINFREQIIFILF